MLGNGSAFGVDVPPRPASAVESRAGVGEVVVCDDVDAQAPAPTSNRQKSARMLVKFLLIRASGRNKVAQLETPCRQLGDAIGANAVDAHRAQGFPLVRFIGSPRYHPRIDGVRARNQIFIYERDLLP